MLERIYQDYKDVGDGFVVIQLIAENYSGSPPSVADMQDWMSNPVLTYIVAADPNWAIGLPYNDTFNGYQFSIPFYWLVDQNLVIVRKGGTPNSYRLTIAELLGSE